MQCTWIAARKKDAVTIIQALAPPSGKDCIFNKGCVSSIILFLSVIKRLVKILTMIDIESESEMRRVKCEIKKWNTCSVNVHWLWFYRQQSPRGFTHDLDLIYAFLLLLDYEFNVQRCQAQNRTNAYINPL